MHELDEADKQCADCGGQLGLWEGHDDETEEIDVIERRFVLKKHVRKKYRCACGCIEMAEMPPRLVPGGRFSNDFAIEVALEKYCFHAPLERQARKRTSRTKLKTGRASRGRWGPAGCGEGFSWLRTGRPKAELPVLGALWTDECLTDERGGPA